MRLPEGEEVQSGITPIITTGKDAVSDACNETNVTPTCLRTLYGQYRDA